MNFRKILRYVFGGLVGASVVFAGASFAGNIEMQEAVDDITQFAEALMTMCTGITAVAIVPAGISASIKAFRHIVLMNV